MAGKSKSLYVCSQCGYESSKWYGKCPGCGEWNTLTEEIREEIKPAAQRKAAASIRNNPAVAINDLCYDDDERYLTGMAELDRVLGGGIVKGSLVLLSGDPGIGKSTLLLQICEQLARDKKVLYVTGEESVRQIKLRATRLGVSQPNLYLLAETDLENVLSAINTEKPDIAIIDSIQTMYDRALNSTPGSVSQVRECTRELINVAKENAIPMFVVGHVNKEGAIAGPKVLEHIVDTVLYFEGERNLPYRILRAVKNRYGSTNEIGVFEMSDSGLKEVGNPSLALLAGRPLNVSGTSVACIIEGSRPILAEVQALVSQTSAGFPRRMSTGFDYNRMSVLLAVLEKRAGYYFSSLDAYLSVVGGLKLDEPAADLPVAISLISSLKDKPIDPYTVAFGEIGLAGELRAVSRAETRIAEVSRLGFKRCVLPAQSLRPIKTDKYDIELIGARSVREAYQSACAQ